MDSNFILSHNFEPLDDFEGFSPQEMHGLLYYPFDTEKSPLRIKPGIDDQLLLKLKMFNDIIQYLRMLKDQQPLKLTPKGNLSRNFCRELYDSGVKDEELPALSSHPINVELDSTYIHVINLLTKVLNLTKKRQGKISLTKKGMDHLKKLDLDKLFQKVLCGYTTRFNWAYSDGYPDSMIIQAGFGYSIYLIQKYGDKSRSIDYYAEKYLRAFPTAVRDFPETSFKSKEELFKSAYGLRVFERFLRRFGFVEFSGKKYSAEGLSVKKTAVVDQIITWEKIT